MMPSQIVPSLNIMSIHDAGTRAGTAERSTSRGLSCSSLRFVQWRRSRCQHGNGLPGVFFQRLLEPETSIYDWLFQLDDSRSFHGKWLFNCSSRFQYFPKLFKYRFICPTFRRRRTSIFVGIHPRIKALCKEVPLKNKQLGGDFKHFFHFPFLPGEMTQTWLFSKNGLKPPTRRTHIGRPQILNGTGLTIPFACLRLGSSGGVNMQMHSPGMYWGVVAFGRITGPISSTGEK